LTEYGIWFEKVVFWTNYIIEETVIAEETLIPQSSKIAAFVSV